MEQEQFFIFVVYDLHGFSDWKLDLDKQIEYRTMNYALTRIAKIKGIATDYIKHKRVQIDFDPIGIKSAWVIVAEFTVRSAAERTETRNNPCILAVEESEEKAEAFLKRMEEGEVKFFLQKGETADRIYKTLLPLIDD